MNSDCELNFDELDMVCGGGIVGDFNTVIQAIGHAVSALGSLAEGNIPAGTGSGAGSGSGSGSAATWPKSTWL